LLLRVPAVVRLPVVVTDPEIVNIPFDHAIPEASSPTVVPTAASTVPAVFAFCFTLWVLPVANLSIAVMSIAVISLAIMSIALMPPAAMAPPAVMSPDTLRRGIETVPVTYKTLAIPKANAVKIHTQIHATCTVCHVGDNAFIVAY
jgi:hypothetical protein